MQNVYKLTPSNFRNAKQIEKTKKNEANISQGENHCVCTPLQAEAHATTG